VIYDDYYRSYLIPPEKYGLKILYDLVEKPGTASGTRYVHKVFQFFATGWLVNYWRIDLMTDDDLNGSSTSTLAGNEFGKWWEHYGSLGAQRAQADRLRGHRVRVSAPLDLHGPVSDP